MWTSFLLLFMREKNLPFPPSGAADDAHAEHDLSEHALCSKIERRSRIRDCFRERVKRRARAGLPERDGHVVVLWGSAKRGHH